MSQSCHVPHHSFQELIGTHLRLCLGQPLEIHGSKEIGHQGLSNSCFGTLRTPCFQVISAPSHCTSSNRHQDPLHQVQQTTTPGTGLGTKQEECALENFPLVELEVAPSHSALASSSSSPDEEVVLKGSSHPSDDYKAIRTFLKGLLPPWLFGWKRFERGVTDCKFNFCRIFSSGAPN